LRSFLQAVVRGLLALAVVGVGVVALLALIKTRPEPERKATPERGVLVEVVKVSSSNQQLQVRAQGTVAAAEKVVVQPEVTGRIVWQSKELVPGGRFKKGQPLIKIDPREYALAADQQGVNVERAQVELEVERGRRKFAEQEWEIIGEDRNATEQDRALALRKPQLEAAKAAVEAARAARSRANLTLGRTGMAAPFNAFVQSENVDVGQLVSPVSQLAVLIGTDAFWVQVAVPLEQLPWIDVPGLNVGKDEGSLATVWQQVGSARVERAGKVIRLLGDLDPVGRLARVLVEVQDPLQLEQNSGKNSASGSSGQGEEQPPNRAVELPFLIGAYVTVDIQGRQVAEVVELPRLALRDGDKVYVYGPKDKLLVRNVDIVWRTEDTVLVRSGVKPGEQVVVSRVPGAVPGMLLRKARPDKSEAMGKR
jgi:multidrug efflux pump subunit AcrA (membrane-fusion protein)